MSTSQNNPLTARPYFSCQHPAQRSNSGITKVRHQTGSTGTAHAFSSSHSFHVTAGFHIICVRSGTGNRFTYHQLVQEDLVTSAVWVVYYGDRLHHPSKQAARETNRMYGLYTIRRYQGLDGPGRPASRIPGALDYFGASIPLGRRTRLQQTPSSVVSRVAGCGTYHEKDDPPVY